MNETFGHILRDLRKANHLTQEQVAEMLNVSFQSLSRWENGISYPDILLIPKIARLFNVSTDKLFNMDTRERENTREHFEAEYTEHRKCGNLLACRNSMRDALDQFPRDFHFMMNLAETLHLIECSSPADSPKSTRSHYATQIRSLCKRVLEDCKKESERLRAKLLLCRHYASRGKTADALLLAHGVADFEHCREVLLNDILSGAEKLHHAQDTMLKLLDYIATTLVGISFNKEYGTTETLSLDDRILYVDTANKLYRLLIPDENYQFFHRILAWNHRQLCELYLLKEDADLAFSELLEAEKHAVAFDNLTEGSYTSPFFNSLSYDPSAYFKCWQGSEQGMLLYRLAELENCFEGHHGFAELRARLEAGTAGEPAVILG